MPPELLPILPYVIAIATVISGGVSWLLRTFVEKRLESETQRKVAEFKHALDSAAAAAAFDYERRLTDHNLFVAKKHGTLAEFYGLIMDASSQLLNAAYHIRPKPILDDTNTEDAETYLRDHAHIPSGKLREILALWDSDRPGALELLDRYQSMMQIELADRAYVKANNFRIKNALYLSEAIAAAAAEVMSDLYQLLLSIRQDNRTNFLAETEHVARLRRLRTLMRSEMAGGAELSANIEKPAITR